MVDEYKVAIEKAEAVSPKELLAYPNDHRKHAADGFVKFDIMDLNGPFGYDMLDGY
jgi:hypothetical protein